MSNNNISKYTGWITNNIGLKLLAIIISVALWFVVNNITDPVDTKPFYNIPVEIVNAERITNEGKVYEILDNSDIITVKVTGKRSVLNYITKDDIKAVADMSEMTFMDTVGIKISSTRNNNELEFESSIENVKFAIEDMKRVQMVINTSTSGKPADGYVVGSITSSQNIVRLQGPESLINKIDHVEATANIDGYASDINTSVELKLYDSDNNEIKSSSIKMNISTVDVEVNILATKEVTLNFVLTDEPAEGYITTGEIISAPETVLIAGRKGMLDTISQITVNDPALSIADKKENLTAIINIRKHLPTGTQFADSTFSGNVSISVGIEPLVTREIEIPAKNFAAGNKPQGFDVTINEFEEDSPKPFKIKISGTERAVNAIKPEDVIGVVDMNRLLEQLGISEWSEGSYSGQITFSLPDNIELEEDYTLTIMLKEKIQEETQEEAE